MRSETDKPPIYFLALPFFLLIPFLLPLPMELILFFLFFSAGWVIVYGVRWEWLKKRLVPFLISLASLTVFSLLLGADINKSLELAVRCLGAFLAFSLLTARITPNDVLKLFSKDRKPSAFALFFYLIYRYLFLVVEEGEKMLRSARARGGGRKSFLGKPLKLFINYILRVLRRSERVALAIEAKGWEGTDSTSLLKDDILLENVSYTYPDGKQALKGINIRIQRGEKIAILGANGAGKSTLLWILGGFLTPLGKVEIFGVEVKKENLPYLRKIVGIVFEDPDDQLLMPTVLEDIAFGLLNLGYKRMEAEQLAKEQLKIFGLEGYEYSHPHNLSQGEKRKATLAGVLVMKPKLLLLDEPSANLDAIARKELIEILSKIDTTSLIATHDIELVSKICDRAIVLQKGEVVYDGSMDALLKERKKLEDWGII
ncbi:ATP-binding cassette domain-containing protein [bacterium]|nr:ATP-binding cassette domain-containing protein [bacterium]